MRRENRAAVGYRLCWRGAPTATMGVTDPLKGSTPNAKANRDALKGMSLAERRSGKTAEQLANEQAAMRRAYLERQATRRGDPADASRRDVDERQVA